MAATIDSISDDLKDIKKTLKIILEMQKQLNDIEEDIKIYEGRQLAESEKIAKAVKRKKFTNIVDWKNAIWEHCPSKEEKLGENTISFRCTMLKGACMFESCPRNVMDDEEYMTTNVP